MSNRIHSATDDAKDTALHFLNYITQQLIEGDDASADLFNDYCDGDSYFHESHIDREYSLSEAADVLETYAEFEETNSDLWEGLPPRDAISAQAAYTYGNAVMSEWQSIIRHINDSDQRVILADMVQDYEENGLTLDDLCAVVRQAIEEA